MKNTLKKDWLIWLFLLAPFAIITYFWDRFPAEIPLHWNMNGEADSYGSKLEGLLLMPLVNIGLYILLLVLPYIDPKKANYALFKSPYQILRFVIHIFLFLAFMMIIFTVLGYDISSQKIIPLAVIALMLVLGNYMGTIRPNYFVGIKTPWTLANEDVWVKTHRFSGKIWVFASLIMLVIALFLPINEIIMLLYIALLVLPPFVYSYLEFRKLESKKL
ncbi:MAG: SdpI family protein [Sphingobacteriales bacterium]|nr:MAG: SdpI family protein [Sphingobacteriales bacterium]